MCAAALGLRRPGLHSRRGGHVPMEVGDAPAKVEPVAGDNAGTPDANPSATTAAPEAPAAKTDAPPEQPAQLQ